LFVIEGWADGAGWQKRIPAMPRYLFGPVNSRRLGRSLGIDLLPFKTCSLDCLYCECGWTTDKTGQRQEYVPTAAVLAELDEFLAHDQAVDAVTFSGSGEPTLHSGIGTVIRHLKRHYPALRVVVLTNSTLLGDPTVQADLAPTDLVVPSLDAATEHGFAQICRPAEGITVQAVIEGIAAFRRGFPGLLLLEVFLVPGVNDRAEELAALKQAATLIGPDALQLNHLDRPAPFPGVTPVLPEQLNEIRAFFQPLPVQIIRRRGAHEPPPWSDPAVFHEIRQILARGPAELPRLALATGLREGDLAKTLAQMSTRSQVEGQEDGLYHLQT